MPADSPPGMDALRRVRMVGGDHRAPRDEDANADSIAFLDQVNAV